MTSGTNVPTRTGVLESTRLLPQGVPVNHDDTHGRRLEALRFRLRRTGALLAAIRRRHDVVSVVGDAASDEEAAEAVSELLDVDPEHAGEIVEMPVKSFSKHRADQLQDEADRLEEKVATLGADRERPARG